MTDGDAPGPAPLPADDGPTFEAPWQARAFGLAMALYRDGNAYEWPAFQERLIDEVAAAEPATAPEGIDADYYEQWLGALERLLIEEGHLSVDEIDERAGEFAAEERTAEEFVEGDRGH